VTKRVRRFFVILVSIIMCSYRRGDPYNTKYKKIKEESMKSKEKRGGARVGSGAKKKEITKKECILVACIQMK
jgi:hypothetical protein